MISPFAARRRADEFEELVSRDSGAPLNDREAERFADLVSLVGDLRAAPPVHARADFVSDLRERLMAEADTVLVAQPSTPSKLAFPVRSRARDRRVATVLGGAALVGATASMAVAAQSSLPGQALYPVKRVIESAQLSLTDGDADRGSRLLTSASDRLGELESLVKKDRPQSDALVPDTLDTFSAQADEGTLLLLRAYDSSGNRAYAEQVRTFTATSMGRLEELAPLLPADARDELLSAGRVLTDLDAAAEAACPTCRGGVAQTPEFLLSAPSDLLAGLDGDQRGLGGIIGQVAPNPISGQSVEGITSPSNLPTNGATLPPIPGPSTTLPPAPGPTTTLPTPGEKIKETGEKIEETLTNTGEAVTNTTGGLTNGLNTLTGGAVGGLANGLNNATNGLIGELTGGLNNATGGTIEKATGGVLP